MSAPDVFPFLARKTMWQRQLVCMNNYSFLCELWDPQFVSLRINVLVCWERYVSGTQGLATPGTEGGGWEGGSATVTY